MAGETAALIFTSPPYGDQRDYTTGGVGNWDRLMQGVFAALPASDATQVLVNLGLIHRDNEWLPYWTGWLEWMRTQRWRRFGLYVWDQGSGLPGDWNGRLGPSFEFIFHFNRAPRHPNKIVDKLPSSIMDMTGQGGLRTKDGKIATRTNGPASLQPTKIPDSVIRIGRQAGAALPGESHPATFPVALPDFVIRAYTNAGDVVFDPFIGSGSTLLAAQQTGRACRAIDIAPEYCEIAIVRWQNQTGRKAVRRDGKVFKR